MPVQVDHSKLNPSTVTAKTYVAKDNGTYPEGSMQWYQCMLEEEKAAGEEMSDDELRDMRDICEWEIPKLDKKLTRARTIKLAPTIWWGQGQNIKAADRANRIKFLEQELVAAKTMLKELLRPKKKKKILIKHLTKTVMSKLLPKTAKTNIVSKLPMKDMKAKRKPMKFMNMNAKLPMEAMKMNPMTMKAMRKPMKGMNAKK
jgi:hypothetical protein